VTEADFQLPVNYFQREVDRLFDDIFANFGLPSWSRLSANGSSLRANGLPAMSRNFMAFRPEVNVSSDDESYTITLEAAGLTENDISIELMDNRLLIKGNKQDEIENRDEYFYRIERRYGQFQRVLDLPSDVKAEAIKAKMANGLLTIQLPRQEQSDHKVRRIAITNS